VGRAERRSRFEGYPATLSTVEEIGLFPLEMVLLPTELVPLHIFEDRYKELIEECAELERPFGLILVDEGGMRAVGTRAAVSEVLERYPDGRLDIVARGGERFSVERVTQGRPFLTAEVESYTDEAEGPLPSADEAAACLDAFRRLMEAAGAEVAPVEPEVSLAFQLAGHIGFEVALKQELLESRSERDRIVRLTELLDAAAEAVQVSEATATARRLAAGNGQVAGHGPED
jgi:Lon protease-like protein